MASISLFAEIARPESRDNSFMIPAAGKRLEPWAGIHTNHIDGAGAGGLHHYAFANDFRGSAGRADTTTGSERWVASKLWDLDSHSNSSWRSRSRSSQPSGAFAGRRAFFSASTRCTLRECGRELYGHRYGRGSICGLPDSVHGDYHELRVPRGTNCVLPPGHRRAGLPRGPRAAHAAPGVRGVPVGAGAAAARVPVLPGAVPRGVAQRGEPAGRAAASAAAQERHEEPRVADHRAHGGPGARGRDLHRRLLQRRVPRHEHAERDVGRGGGRHHGRGRRADGHRAARRAAAHGQHVAAAAAGHGRARERAGRRAAAVPVVAHVSPMHAAGCYAPGGRYPLPSSVLMTAVTARVAGVQTVVVASPRPAPATLAAAYLAGADYFLAAGGAQAIAAMAYGVGGVPACDIIVGPGNKWVTAAKSLVFGKCAIDMLAGPSECLVIADESADAATIAADLLAQAEHDTAAVPILVTTSQETIDAVNEQLAKQLETLPSAPTASVSVQNGFAVLCPDMATCVSVSDVLAPEHLEVITSNAREVADQVSNYGGLFVGGRAAEVFGDYGAGPNHVLPTGGTAKYTGGLSVHTFLRIRTWMRIDDAQESQALVKDSALLARMEGLEGHARAAEKRLL
ncbi:unnamed protein product [Phytophthora fragariaefolia]|uniref:Unnamed protein product n=1 Tax=Phytophthora fragariaefolia TaxID=1490495 RepID=A0A9W6WWP9_9STRA|nr:unnamed protein product [Phytophthora fragariaefolia]